MSAVELLTELAEAGIHLSLAGSNLRYRTQSGVRIAPCRERITANKAALVAALRERDVPHQPNTPGDARRLAPGEAAAMELDPTLAWIRVDRGPVPPTIPPEGWDGGLCGGCQWRKLCAELGPRGPHLPGGPCAAWPSAERRPDG